MVRSRDEILGIKAAAVAQDLDAWTKEEKILGPGERLVFSLHVEQVNLVRRDEHDTMRAEAAPLPIKGSKRRASGKVIRYVAHATLTHDQVQEVLGLFKGVYYDFLCNILVTRNNNPTTDDKGYALRYLPKINMVLDNHRVDGKPYRLASRFNFYQLWQYMVVEK